MVVQQVALSSSDFFGRIILGSSGVPDGVSYLIEHFACDTSRHYYGYMGIDVHGGVPGSRTPPLGVYGEPT
jgi:hypothetical protein